MILPKHLISIRKKHDLSQEEFAVKLGVSSALIRSLEDGFDKATPEFVAKLRNAFNLNGIPLTDDEKKLFYGELHNLRFLIDYGLLDSAAEVIPSLTRRAKASCYMSFINLSDIFTAYYHFSINSFEACEKAMAALHERRQSFDIRHHYYYNILVGMQAYKARDYDKALEAYIKAEELDKNAQLREAGFYHMYGMILSEMGYTARAISYHKKAVHHAKWNKGYHGKPNTRYDVGIDSYLAYNLSKIGQKDEAFEILNKRLETVKTRGTGKEIGLIHHSLGKVHLRIGDYSEAIANFETAFRYLPKDSKLSNTNLYYKALALITGGREKEGIVYVDEGLNISTDDILKVRLEALKHSIALHDYKSILYMKNTIMPKLLEYGLYEEALKYYKAISDFYAEDGNDELALVYLGRAYAIIERFCENRVEKGL